MLILPLISLFDVLIPNLNPISFFFKVCMLLGVKVYCELKKIAQQCQPEQFM